MLDMHAPIEQLIFTGGGSTKENKNNSEYGVWAASLGLEEYIKRDIRSICAESARGRYDPQYTSRKTVTATEGNKLEENVVEADRLMHHKIHILESNQCSKTGDISLSHKLYADFRDEPEKAPYRIGVTVLADGRLLVFKTLAINRMYAEGNYSCGNVFSHAFLFPKGTTLDDININNLPFKNGLKMSEWGTNGTPCDTLKTLSKVSLGQVDTLKDLMSLFEQTLISVNPDANSRKRKLEILKKYVIIYSGEF